jgi:hypothetical protein
MPEPRRLARSHASSGRARIHAPAAKVGSSPLQPSRSAAPRQRGTPPLLLFTRWILPGVIILAGAIAASFGTIDALYGGSSLIAAGIAVWLISWAYRFGADSDDERDAEARARAYFERFGRWPDGS